MPTDLFVAASRLPARALGGAIPPACRRGIDPAPAPRADGSDAVVEFPEWRPRGPASHLLPSFSPLSPTESSFRFELSARAGARWSPWVGGATLGAHGFPPIAERAEGLAAEIDEFVPTPPAEAVRLRLRLRAADARALRESPWLVALSAWDGAPPTPAARSEGHGPRLEVPAFSQMAAEDEALRRRICSPASVAMVLAYHGRPVDVAALAREMFHPGLDRYGVWPAAIRAAGRRGVGGYLLRFPDWASAAWCLERGLPVVASVRYRAGELAGAAIAETTGHLLVLTGWDNDEILVNDPAAPRVSEVTRRYRRDELARVWLERAGVGYVLFTPSPSPGGRSPRP